MSSATFERQAALLRWYVAHQRVLPWRHPEAGPHPEPYAVLVSELMLQQTRVDAVLAPYARWMQRFPSFEHLAAAPVDDAVAAWAGLGYYRRARALHAAAVAVVREHGGSLPRDPAALAALPGVGPYTAGALRSIAFAEPAPLVDGNVARVLARWTAEQGDEAALKRAAWRVAAEQLAPAEAPARADPARWSQALMELGALVCKPANPACTHCPVRAGCLADAGGLQASIPAPRQRRPPQLVAAVAVVVARARDGDSEVLLHQRPARGRWAGLWQPPLFEASTPADAAAQARAWLGGLAERARPSGALVHVLTHRRYEVALWRVELSRTEAAPDAGTTAAAWRPRGAIRGVGDGISRLGARVVGVAMDG